MGGSDPIADLEAQTSHDGAVPLAAQCGRSKVQTPTLCLPYAECIAIAILQVHTGLLLLVSYLPQALAGEGPAQGGPGMLDLLGAGLLSSGPLVVLTSYLLRGATQRWRCCSHGALMSHAEYTEELRSSASDSSPGSGSGKDTLAQEIADEQEGSELSKSLHLLFHSQVHRRISIQPKQLSSSQLALIERHSQRLSAYTEQAVDCLLRQMHLCDLSPQDLGRLVSDLPHIQLPPHLLQQLHLPPAQSEASLLAERKREKRLVQLKDQEIMEIYRGAIHEAHVEADWRGIDEWPTYPTSRSHVHHSSISEQCTSRSSVSGDRQVGRGDTNDYLQMLAILNEIGARDDEAADDFLDAILTDMRTDSTEEVADLAPTSCCTNNRQPTPLQPVHTTWEPPVPAWWPDKETTSSPGLSQPPPPVMPRLRLGDDLQR